MGAPAGVNATLTDVRESGFSKFHHEVGTNKIGTDGPLVAFMRQMLARMCRGPGADMHRSEEYRGNAAACARLAMTVSDPEARLTLAAMSAAWLRLADFVEQHGPNEQTNAGASDGGSPDRRD